MPNPLPPALQLPHFTTTYFDEFVSIYFVYMPCILILHWSCLVFCAAGTIRGAADPTSDFLVGVGGGCGGGGGDGGGPPLTTDQVKLTHNESKKYHVCQFCIMVCCVCLVIRGRNR